MGVRSGRPGNRRRRNAGQIFGGNLRRLCKARQLDAVRLAELTGLGRRSVERMLRGEGNPTLSLLRKLAGRLDVALAELVRGL